MTIFRSSLPAAAISAVIALVIGAAGATAASARSASPAQEPIETGDTPAGNYLAAVVAGSARDTTAAALFYKEALKFDPRSGELLERAFIAQLADGNITDAMKLAERIVARDPRNGLAQLALGVRAMKNRQWASARAHLSRGGKGQAGDLTATLLTAWTWLGSGEPKKAVETVDKLKSEQALAVFRDYHAGLIFAVAGNMAEARNRLGAAYNAENRTLRMVDVYGRFLSRAGDKDGALKTYEAFDKLLPRHPIVTDAMASVRAGKTLDPAVADATAGAAEVLYGLGAAGNRQGDELAAMVYLRLSLWLKPGNDLAVLTLADLYERLKQPEKANEVYRLIGADSPVSRNAAIQIAVNLEQMERSQDAIDMLTSLVAERPKDVDAYSALGRVYSSRKQFAEAGEAYGKAIDAVEIIDPGHWTLFYFRGIANERLKRWPQAEADFKKALQLAPDQPLVLNYLGYSWVDQGMNLPEAFKMLERAVQQRPSDGFIVDSLGWAHYRLGHYDDAVRILERAVELKASDPVINDHLGDAYYKVGRKLEATFQWNHARDLKPEPEDLPRILKKIERGSLEEEPTPAAAEVDIKKNGG